MAIREATIIINGNTLTNAQSMTLRVAIENFASDLKDNGLGDDETGQKIAAGYLKGISVIRSLTYID